MTTPRHAPPVGSVSRPFNRVEPGPMARTETVTVVFTDLVGSTELANRLGHDAYETLRHTHFGTLRTAAAAHNGVEIKTTGDGLMLSFTSAADGIACAVAMQQATDGAARR